MTTLDYRQFGGQYSETAALRNVLTHAGVMNPHTGQPFSEAMLLGVGGGIGAAYILFDSGERVSIYIGTRYHTGSGEFLQGIAQRLGLAFAVKQTAGGKGAARSLRDALEQGQPAILSVDRASLPFQAFPPQLIKYMEYTIVAFGLDDEAGLAYVGDVAATPLTITSAELAAARLAITNQRHRMMTVAPHSHVGDMSVAIRDAINACVAAMATPSMSNFSGNFGLNGLSKWATMLTDDRDKKAWPQVTHLGSKLYPLLVWVFRYIETYDGPGAAFRAMYADFLDEASAILNKAALREVATRYRHLARQWSDLAAAALPDAIAPFRETKELLTRRRRIFAEQGSDALPQMLQIGQRVAALGDEMKTNFPLTQEEATALLHELGERVARLHTDESEAITALQAAIA